MPTISELRVKSTELRKIADKLDAAADALAELGGTEANGAASRPESDVGINLSQLSGLDAMERVMGEAGRPVSKADLSRRLRMHGKAIGDATLEAYLSRGKRAGRFTNFGRGIWGLPINLSTPARTRTRSEVITQ
jgi:hypothetical protein